MAKIERKDLTQQLVIEYFEYKDGGLYWKKAKSNSIKIGDLAGTFKKCRNHFRSVIHFKCKQYYTSRLIYFFHTGIMPQYIDHIDRNPLNDKIENLRPATAAENARNTTSAKNSFSKYLGVTFHIRVGKWIARIRVENKSKHLGCFQTEQLAALAYNKAAVKYFGEFANLNIIENEKQIAPFI